MGDRNGMDNIASPNRSPTPVLPDTPNSPPSPLRTQSPQNDESSEDPNDVKTSQTGLPTNFTLQTVRKRVPGKLVDRFWAPLDAETFSSLERIISVCSSKAVERYRRDQKKTQFNKKMASAQEIVANSWADRDNKSSFLSRLKVTKVPLPTSHSKRNSSEDMNVLGFDSLNRRKKFLETYLQAELKQVNELERYHQELSTVYQQDLKYLQEFKKTTEIEMKAMTEEAAELRRNMGLEKSKKTPEAEYVEKPVKPFNPNEDPDTLQLLTEIRNKLDPHQDSYKKLADADDALEVLYNLLDIEAE
ncbi:hypothetical protein JA9_001610 [Meyerozyma sp. JA9]|nr:hypothetical protein JA9_001610 [Meyerozyma sp. JA9]